MEKIAVVLLDAGQKSGHKPMTEATFDRTKCRKELIEPITSLLPLVHRVVVVVRADGSVMAEEAVKDATAQEGNIHENTPTTRELLRHFGKGTVECLIPVGHWWSLGETIHTFARNFAFAQDATKVVTLKPGEEVSPHSLRMKIAKGEFHVAPEVVH